MQVLKQNGLTANPKIIGHIIILTVLSTVVKSFQSVSLSINNKEQ